jgi:hypothetical protein
VTLPIVRPTPPREQCPDVEDCVADPTDIGHICTFGPVCGTCIVFRVNGTARGLLEGSCRVRPDRGLFACTAAICDGFIPRSGAPNARGETATEADRRIVTATDSKQRTRTPRAVEPIVRPRERMPDGPVGELEMTRDELKALIREAMDEERGGAEVSLATKWSGGAVVVKPGNPDLQGHEVPVDALFRKVVAVRDRLRVLEQKLNAHPKLEDAEKVELQGYITKCYGSLTTFNVLFRDKDDKFQGEKSSGKDDQ